jgi:biotin carboxyl carrier protein
MKRYWVRLGAEEFEIAVQADGDALSAVLDGKTHRILLAAVVPSRYTFIVDGVCHDLGIRDRSASWTLSLDGAAHVAEVARAARPAVAGRAPDAAGVREIRAPMPGLLVSVHVGEGARVVEGEPVAIMEAMKMQMEIRAPRPGTVRQVGVAAGQELTAGQVLMTID